jgi:hypothetical protein
VNNGSLKCLFEIVLFESTCVKFAFSFGDMYFLAS